MAVLKYKDTNGEWKKLFDGLKISADEALNEGSTNPIQNKPVAEAINRLTAEKQDRLISGVNIRKINGQDLLDPDQLDKDIIIPPGSKTYVLYPLSFSNGNATVDELNEHSANHIDIHKEIYDSVINNETYNYIEGYTAGYAMKLDGSTYVALNKIIKNKNDNNYITFTSVILTDDNQIVTTDLTIREDGSIRSDVTTRTTYITDETIEPFLATKQNILIDGTENTPSGDQNIKTIGGESIFGEGNIPVTASIESGKDIKNLEDTEGTYDIVGEGSILLKTLTVNGEVHSLIGDENNKTITIAGGGGSYDDTELRGDIALKQDKLIDANTATENETINIKTINGQSLLISEDGEETNIQISTGEGGGEQLPILRPICVDDSSLPADAEETSYQAYNINTIKLVSEGKAIPVMDGFLPLMHAVSGGTLVTMFEVITYELGDMMGAILGGSDESSGAPIGMKTGLIVSITEDGETSMPSNSGLLAANVIMPKCIDPGLPVFNLDIFGFGEDVLGALGGSIEECIAEFCNELSASPVDPDTETYEVIYGIEGADINNIPDPSKFKEQENFNENGWYDTEDAAKSSGSPIIKVATSTYGIIDEETEQKGWSTWSISDYTAATAAEAELEDEYATSTADDTTGDAPTDISIDKLLSISKSIYTYYNHISAGNCIGMVKGGVMDFGYPTAYVNPINALFNIMKMFPTLINDLQAEGGNITFNESKIIQQLVPDGELVIDLIGRERAEEYFGKAIEILTYYMSDSGILENIMGGEDMESMFMSLFFSSSIVQNVTFGEPMLTASSSSALAFPAALDVQYSFGGTTFLRHYLLDIEALSASEPTLGNTMFFDEIVATGGVGGGESVESAPEVHIGNDTPPSDAVIWINPDGTPAGEKPGSSIVVCSSETNTIGSAVSGVTYIKSIPSDASDKSFKVTNYAISDTNLSHYTFHLKGVSSIELPSGTIWANGLIPDALDPNNIYEIDVYGTKFDYTYYYKATYAVFALQ